MTADLYSTPPRGGTHELPCAGAIWIEGGIIDGKIEAERKRMPNERFEQRRELVHHRAVAVMRLDFHSRRKA